MSDIVKCKQPEFDKPVLDINNKEGESKKEIKTIIRPYMSSYSFDMAVNEALDDGFEIIKMECTSTDNSCMLCAILIRNKVEDIEQIEG